jgi:hypothetical protein
VAWHSFAQRPSNLTSVKSECQAGKVLEKLMSEARRLLTPKPSPVAWRRVLT